MGALRKTVSSNLGEETDKDLINYVGNMEKRGINNSKLIKQALRFYRDYGNKVKQLDTVDIANILDNPEVKDYIGNMVGELFRDAMPQTDDEFDAKKTNLNQKNKKLDSVEIEYRKRLSRIKDMSL
ncbi:hypothetical protein [Clostridium psychrophilum]|uniref:hypothetical protein n=1 Tax=Clostridium psychrophilum TaxID=132926 RepID=UPI001C0CA766|nr:hypothetical protein [Clostridium psychrophilum]MBU3182394.1 hypothetical protein [Clostridium psychrophilum]